MSETAVASGHTAWRSRLGTESPPAGARLGTRRVLQLALAVGWLLSPGVTVGCRIAMGAAMAFMLLIMI
jgi:hypothetical protein